jgi:hypothetical protein
LRDFWEDLPEGYKIVDFSRAHFLMLELEDIQATAINAFDGYADWLDAVAKMGVSWTCLHRGIPIFCTGIYTALPGVGEGWMLRDVTFRDHGMPFARRARRYYDQVGPALGLRRIQFSVHAQDLASQRFAEWLKFETEGTMRQFSTDGSDVLMMSRIY